MAGIHIPYERILEKIQQNSGLSKEEIEAKMDVKLKQLSGLISKQGAAHIVANELGVKLIEQISGKLKIGNILAGMRDVETDGKIVRVFEARTFETERGPGRVGSFILGDDTGTVRVVLWNNQADKISQLTEDSIVRIVGGYTRNRKDQNGNDRVEVHLNDRSKLIMNPPGVEIAEIKPMFSRKKLKDLTPEDRQVEILGTVIQVFDPRFFEVCPKCGKRVREVDGAFKCEAHGAVTPNHSYVLNLFLDDSTSTIRLVCFREQVLRLLNKSDEEFLTYREAPETFEQVKTDLLGQIIKVDGRVTKNEMFDRLELIAQLIFPNPNVEEELKRLQEEAGETEQAAPEESKEPKEEIVSQPDSPEQPEATEKTEQAAPEEPKEPKEEIVSQPDSPEQPKAEEKTEKNLGIDQI